MAEFMYHSYCNLGEYLSLGRAGFLGYLLSYKKTCNRKTSSCNKIKHRIEDQKSVVYGRWHEVPKDIMELVLQRLNLDDRVRLNGVCKAWRSLVKQEDIRVAPEFPWLLLPQIPKSKHLSFCNLFEGKTHDIKLPEVSHGGWCCGSSKGWLIIAKKTWFESDIFLLNPLSGVEYQLPCLATIPCFDKFLDENMYPRNVSPFISKWELSSANPSSECIVAAVFKDFKVLACCRPRDESWTVFQFRDHDTSRGSNDLIFSDIVFLDEMLYVMAVDETYKDSLTSIYTLDLPDDHRVTLKILSNLREERIVDVEDINGFGIAKEGRHWYYLVKSFNDHELLMVHHIMDVLIARIEDEYKDEDEDEDSCPYLRYCKTCKFEVFKLASDAKSMSKLENLGDQVMFLTRGGSLILSARYFSGIKGNCIYFADDINNLNRHHALVSRETGIFYLDDERIERSFPSTNLPHPSRLSWFLPNPW